VNVQGVGELGLLERIRPYLGAGAGLDDAAVIAEGSGYLVASADMFVEGVHFDLEWTSAEDAGWRALALALGDLAAKGAQPDWALASIAIPKHWKVEDVSGLYAGMDAVAERFNLRIAGGDMSSIAGPAVLSLTVVGRTDSRPLARSDAQAGWSVGVTGPLGGAAAALREHLAHRLVPLIDEGRRLNHLGLCCGDISDGLVREMEKFAAMSGVGCELHADEVPCAAGATLEEALTSGEEAELVCAGPESAIAKAGLHVIGTMTAGKTVKVVGADLKSTGYDHFA